MSLRIASDRLNSLAWAATSLPERLVELPSPLAGEGARSGRRFAARPLVEAMQQAERPRKAYGFLYAIWSGREPLLGQLCAHLGVDLTVSGHMGSPWTAVWDEFAVQPSAV